MSKKLALLLLAALLITSLSGCEPGRRAPLPKREIGRFLKTAISIEEESGFAEMKEYLDRIGAEVDGENVRLSVWIDSENFRFSSLSSLGVRNVEVSHDPTVLMFFVPMQRLKSAPDMTDVYSVRIWIPNILRNDPWATDPWLTPV